MFYNRHNIKPVDISHTPPSNSPTPPADTQDAPQDVWYAIDRLLDHKTTLYLVKWQDKTRSWEPAENITDFAVNECQIRREQRKNADNVDAELLRMITDGNATRLISIRTNGRS